MVEHFQYGQLSVLVPLVLEDFLDGDCFSCLRNGCLEHYSEGTIANDFLSVVCEALLNNGNYEVKNDSIRLNLSSVSA